MTLIPQKPPSSEPATSSRAPSAGATCIIVSLLLHAASNWHLQLQAEQQRFPVPGLEIGLPILWLALSGIGLCFLMSSSAWGQPRSRLLPRVLIAVTGALFILYLGINIWAASLWQGRERTLTSPGGRHTLVLRSSGMMFVGGMDIYTSSNHHFMRHRIFSLLYTDDSRPDHIRWTADETIAGIFYRSSVPTDTIHLHAVHDFTTGTTCSSSPASKNASAEAERTFFEAARLQLEQQPHAGSSTQSPIPW